MAPKLARSLDEAAAGFDAVEYRDHYLVRDTYGAGTWHVVDELGPNGLPMFEGSIIDCVHAIDEVQDEAEAETAAEAAGLVRCEACGTPGAGDGNTPRVLCDRCEALAARVEAVIAPRFVRVTCNNALACGACKMTAGDVQANGYRCACSTSEGR